MFRYRMNAANIRFQTGKLRNVKIIYLDISTVNFDYEIYGIMIYE